MDPRLAVRFDRLEVARREIVDRLSEIDHETLNRRPRDDAWSVIQVLYHVTLAEELSIRFIEKKSRDASPSRAGLMERLRSWALCLAMRSPLRFTAPPMTAELPESDSLESVTSRWEEVRARMREILTDIPAETVDRAVYRHPVVGTMSVEQAVRFFEDHLAHHVKQIDRTLRAVGSVAG